VPLGTNYYRSPRLRLRATFLAHRLAFSASAHSLVNRHPSLLRNAPPSYLTILKHRSTHILYLSLRIGEADSFFRNTLSEMAGDRRKPSFPVPNWGTCHKRAGWCPNKNMMGSVPCMMYMCSTDLSLAPPSNATEPSNELNPRPSRSPGSRPLSGFRSLLLRVPESE
jgi:hypothetical protein